MGASKREFQEIRQSAGDETEYLPAPQALQNGITTLKTIGGEGIDELAKEYVQRYTDGHHSPAEGLALVKKLEGFVELVKANISDFATNELKLGKGEKATIAGMQVSEQMAGVRYDYTVCKDVLWDKHNKLKGEREEFLKTVKGQVITGDPETGETWMAHEPSKSGKMTLIFKYPK